MKYENKDELTLAYIAGVFDAEGSVMIGMNNGNYRLSVSLGNTKREIVDLFNSLFPGYIQIRKYDNPEHNDLYIWNVDCKKAGDFLSEISKYSRIKKEQIMLGIDLRETQHLGCNGLSDAVKKKRIEIAASLAALNHRGIAVCET